MSTLRADTIQNTSGGAVTLTKQSAAKAWVQTASGAAPSGSFNISGVVDNSTGNYTVSFSSAMANDDYSPTATRIVPGANRDVGFLSNATTNVVIYSSTASAAEDATCFSTVHGDLA